MRVATTLRAARTRRDLQGITHGIASEMLVQRPFLREVGRPRDALKRLDTRYSSRTTLWPGDALRSDGAPQVPDDVPQALGGSGTGRCATATRSAAGAWRCAVTERYALASGTPQQLSDVPRMLGDTP